MSNQIIKNKQPSILVLSPLQDAFGADLTLRPHGHKGDEREITAETAADEIIVRVKAARWVEVVDKAPAPPVVETPAPEVPPAPPVVVETPAPEVPPAPPVVVETPAPAPDSKPKSRK